MKELQSFTWRRLFVLTLLVCYFYGLMEWIFFVTKPSFMGEMTLVSKIMVLFTASGIMALIGMAVIIIIWGFSVFLSHYKAGSIILLYLAMAFPAAIFAILTLMLLDNFTYTVFKFGVVSLSYPLRGGYAIGFVLLLFYFAREGLHFVRTTGGKRQNQLLILAGVLSSFSVLFILVQIQLPSQQAAIISNTNKRPNILIIGSDGVNANNMSLYGYERKTTPYLEQISPEFLLAENAFTNAGSTTVSITTILTGKLTSQTKFVSGSDILFGEDAYQHLPGILHRLNYYNVQIGVPHFVDSYAMNLQDGFDVVNGRSYDQSPVLQMIRKIGLGNASYFLSIMFERASSRILHIFYVRDMENPIEAVTNDEHAGLSDPEKVSQIIDLVENTQSPVFIHAHLMGTHGPSFNPVNRIFSSGEEQSQDWMGDFYDDSILDFDGYVSEIINALSKSGELDNTILVIYTDHNMLYRTNQRIPLMIRFPKGEWARRVSNNVQNIDIAPTILDYLEIDKPVWMAGQSFLRNDPPQNRLIQSGVGGSNIRIVQCDRWYRVALLDGAWSTGEVTAHTAPCEHLDVKSKADLSVDIKKYLAENKVEIQEKPSRNDVYSTFVVTRRQVTYVLLQKKYGVSYTPPPAKGVFSDVLISDPDIDFIEQAYREGIIDSCSSSPLSYCPDQTVTRGEAAIYLLKAVEGKDYRPPPAKGVFADVLVSSPFAPWIEELYTRHITQGCTVNPLNYCPSTELLGEHLEVFVGRAFSQP